MFKKTRSTEELINELNKKVNEEITIHYHCEDCGDEQTTGDIFVSEDMIEELESNDYILVNMECTNCGTVTKFLDSADVFGIED